MYQSPILVSELPPHMHSEIQVKATEEIAAA